MFSVHRALIPTILLLAFTMLLAAGEFAARLNYRICVPDEPAKIESTAAAELAAYLEKSFTEKIRLNGSDDPILFSVGFAPEAREFSKAKDAFTESGFGVFRRGRTILLTGLDDPDVRPYAGYEEGTLLSVYYFLRRYTGLKIFAPDPVRGEKTGHNPELQLPEADKPVFSFSIRGIGMNFTDVPYRQMALYARKQLCHDFRWSTANVYYLVLNRWNKRFKHRPELFGIHQGRRQSANYPYHLPCFSNPEVKKIIVDDILKMIRDKKLEERAVIRLFSDAPFRRCECPECARFAGDNDYFYGFIVSVWEEVKKSFPETRLFLQEKGRSHNSPPSTGDLKGVVVDIATGFPGAVDYRKAQPLFRQWKERGALPTVRLYVRHPKWGSCPIINPHDAAANLRAVKGLALGQRRSDCGNSGAYRIPYAFVALTNYVYVNCLLDADADPDALIREFCEFMYPGAAQEVAAFYDWMEKRRAGLAMGDNPYFKCYPYNVLDRPAALLDAAAAKCTDRFWLDKLRAAFDAFREEAHALEKLTAHVEENARKKERLQAEFRERFAAPFVFSAAGTTFPLCPQNIPSAPIQDSSVKVAVEQDRLVFQLTAMEEHPELLRRNATPDNAGNVWDDDSFEVMIAPETRDVPYIQFGINANGAVMALRYDHGYREKALKLDGDWRASATVEKERWTAAFAVPLALVRELCPEGRGRIGIFRTRVLTNSAPGASDYYSASSGLDAEAEKPAYHDLARYHRFELR